MSEQEYQRNYQLQRYHRRHAQAIVILGGKCVKCGATEDLQIDHVDPATKEIELSKLWGVSEERWKRELAKCQLLCRPCHKTKTSSEQRRDVHGTWGMIRNRKCKCDVCKAFFNAYQRDYKRRKKLIPG